MNPIIDVKNISKSYQISHQEKASYDTIKDDFSKLIKKPFGGGSDSEQETFWALKDINFQVNKGEIFGIIGKNGSGKSTLLKILSRIVDPTSGSVTIHGKVASLLEVGTGFHPELTGRENIYFNGSMIGMSKQEITRKFDEIVAFSGVEQFLDTPVKFYSSGMFVRLAFSVAAHLDSEVLILDEVLSVGDAVFQKKSLNKMLSIVKEGRTILIVSHSMVMIQQLCDRALLLQKGKVKAFGPTYVVADEYLGTEEKKRKKAKPEEEKDKFHDYPALTKLISKDLAKRTDRETNGKVLIKKIKISNLEGSPFIKSFDRLKIEVEIDALEPLAKIRLDLGFYDMDDHILFRTDSGYIDRPDTKKITITTGPINLPSMLCYVNALVYTDNGEWGDYVKKAQALEIHPNPSKEFKSIKQYEATLATLLVEANFEY